MNIDKIRKDTLNCENLIHFNNAGASLPSEGVNKAILQWLHEEERIGGYEMEAKHASEIANIYDEIAKLIKCEKDEIAITDNASTAFSKALYSIPFAEGDEIITSDVEYVNNYLNYLKLKKDIGVKIISIAGNQDGPIDLKKLKAAISTKTKLISITHMPTSSGTILPVRRIGEIAKEHGILYLVDTCQSIGHYPTFVDEIHCDFLTATSRKYLRGPRGLGFLYVKKSLMKKLNPYMLEAMGASWESKSSYKLHQTAKMFECFEKPYAFMMGFQEAIRYANELGIDNIWKRVESLSSFARECWAEIPGLTFHDGNGSERSGIITLTLKDKNPEELQEILSKHKVNASICKSFTSLTDMQSKGLVASNRLSLHYYNSKEEIERVRYILQNVK